jgi:3-hydroxyacyl-[acyl-carrier-protein] dehydratase
MSAIETRSRLALPFAAPLRATDEVLVGPYAGGLRVRARKRVDPADPYLPGHFPLLTVYPGVFMVESVRQAVAVALTGPGGEPPEIAELRSLRFLAPAFAGDELTIEADIAETGAGAPYDVRARCRRGDGATVATLAIAFRAVEPAHA